MQAAKLLVFTVDALAAAYPSSACVLLLFLVLALGLRGAESVASASARAVAENGATVPGCESGSPR